MLVLLAGLAVIFRSGAGRNRGIEMYIHLGRLFFAVPLAVFSAEHFIFHTDIAKIVPSWIPGHLFWTYFVGCALIAAALSIAFQRYTALAAALLGLMFFLFAALIDAPASAASRGDRFAVALMLRQLSFSGGALALAAAEFGDSWQGISAGVRAVCRLMIAIPALFYGLEHFLHPLYVPVIPLKQLLPDWIPGRVPLAYLTGAVLLASGFCILFNWRARLAAAWLGIAVFGIVVVVYSAFLVGESFSIRGLNFFADTLMYSGAILILAGALPKEDPSHA